MFGELPKLLDRNFALGYFLPGTVYLIATLYLLDNLNIGVSWLAQFQKDLLVGTTTIGLISWLLGIFLLGANRSIYRILEGYGKYNPTRLWNNIEKRRYAQLTNELENLDKKYLKFEGAGMDVPLAVRMHRNELLQHLAERFPDKPEWILPTKFGNIIRAFEVYPRVVYGVEAIQGWNRLLAVISKDYRELIDDSKSQVDFWVNLGFLGMLFLVQYIGFSMFSHQVNVIWLPVLVLILTYVAASRAADAAVQWGELIKSAFDVFLPKLKKELELTTLPEDEKNAWIQFSQVAIYRLPEVMQAIRVASYKNNKAHSQQQDELSTEQDEELYH